MRRKKGYFSISAVAEMFSIHPQTIRLYEQEGLINPKRTEGNTRLFSEEDVEKLEEIVYLTHHLGINLAGVEMVLKLKKQIKKMQKQMNAAFDETNKELEKQEELSKSAITQDAKRLMPIHKGLRLPKKSNDDLESDSSKNNEEPSVSLDREVEYEK